MVVEGGPVITGHPSVDHAAALQHVAAPPEAALQNPAPNPRIHTIPLLKFCVETLVANTKPSERHRTAPDRRSLRAESAPLLAASHNTSPQPPDERAECGGNPKRHRPYFFFFHPQSPLVLELGAGAPRARPACRASTLRGARSLRARPPLLGRFAARPSRRPSSSVDGVAGSDALMARDVLGGAASAGHRSRSTAEDRYMYMASDDPSPQVCSEGGCPCPQQ